MIRHAIIATAGHVDHGKSALVKALTGIDPDRLPEEKARGITLDLGFAHLKLPSERSGEYEFHAGIVDVPGHEDFVKKMITGVGQIHLALLVVAADDGWMPQTEEHLQILEYLGIQHAVVALTKTDIAAETEALAIENIKEKLQNSTFSNSPIVPTSIITGRGIAELKHAIREQLTTVPQPRDVEKPRLPIDRVFTLRGVGTVVTGTLFGGKLNAGQEVLIQPKGISARVRSIQTHYRETESVEPGMRVALNLPDAAGVERGQIVGLSGFGEPGNTWDVVLQRSPRLPKTATAYQRLRHGALVNVHFASAMVPARVALAHAGDLGTGDRGIAQLRFSSPQWAFFGDRFVIRDASARNTLAGGVVLDPNASRKNFRDEKRQRFLVRASLTTKDAAAIILALVERDRIIPRSQLLLKSNFSREEIQGAISQLSKEEVIEHSDFLMAASDWKTFCQAGASAIDAHHQNHPEQTGLPLSEMRTVFRNIAFSSEMAELVLRNLLSGDFVQHGTCLARKTHHPQLPPHLRAAASEIRATLAARPLDPPARAAIAPDPTRREALRYLLQSGEAIELNHEIVLSAQQFARARDSVCRYLQDHASATVSELRQALTASRRVVVPLLERLDREGFTSRTGDSRSLKKRKGVTVGRSFQSA